MVTFGDNHSVVLPTMTMPGPRHRGAFSAASGRSDLRATPIPRPRQGHLLFVFHLPVLSVLSSIAPSCLSSLHIYLNQPFMVFYNHSHVFSTPSLCVLCTADPVSCVVYLTFPGPPWAQRRPCKQLDVHFAD